jgi:hypothetical protein
MGGWSLDWVVMSGLLVRWTRDSAPSREGAGEAFLQGAARAGGAPRGVVALEAEQKALDEKMSAGDYHKLGAEEVKTDRRRAEEIEGELMGKLERWEKLEGKASAAAT